MDVEHPPANASIGEQFWVVVSLCLGKFFAKEGTWMESVWVPLLLRWHCSYLAGGCIKFDDEGFVGVWTDQERCTGESL